MVVRSAQSFHKLYDQLSSKLGSEVVNRAFYYLRAWAIERGLWDNPHLPRNKVTLSPYDILTLMDDSAQEVCAVVAGYVPPTAPGVFGTYDLPPMIRAPLLIVVMKQC